VAVVYVSRFLGAFAERLCGREEKGRVLKKRRRMLARGFLRSRRTAVGVATVRGPMQYVTAAGIVVFDGERVVSVEIAMESEATVVVGLSRYVDSEFVTSSAVASIDHPGKGAALAAIDASGAPYVTLVVVRGSYVGRVSVVVVCESGVVTPAIRALALPARILPVRQVRGAALLAVAESVTAAPGCFVVQQTRQMSTTLFVVELIELDGSKHELVAGELSIVEVSSRLAVTVWKTLPPAVVRRGPHCAARRSFRCCWPDHSWATQSLPWRWAR
jgi:hypothetical protein